MSEMITKNHTLVAEFGDSLDRLLDGIENFMANSRPTLGGERFLTDKEVSDLVCADSMQLMQTQLTKESILETQLYAQQHPYSVVRAKDLFVSTAL